MILKMILLPQLESMTESIDRIENVGPKYSIHDVVESNGNSSNSKDCCFSSWPIRKNCSLSLPTAN